MMIKSSLIKKSFFAVSLVAALCHVTLAQNANTSATPEATMGRRRTTSTGRTSATPATTQQPAAPHTTPQPTPRGAPSTAEAAEVRAVREAFDSLVDGIRRADAEAVMSLYWNSPQLVVFNNNGTVTKTWEQARSNRESLYEKISDVKLDVRDVRVKTLGPSAALVTCLWDQSQTAEGQPEHATGRLSIIYQKIGTAWKIVHTHTSPDRPNPSNLLPSERTNEGDTTAPARRPAKP
jgi:uncharacterized protein (TIGR02246 family)